MNYNSINSPHNSWGWVKFTFVLFLWIFVGFVNKVSGQSAYAVYNDKVLTFYYDTQRASRTGTTYGINDLSSDYPAWLDVEYRNGIYYPRNEITKVIFDASFANYKPKTCSSWFYRCSKLTEIQDIEKYLKTDEVTNMSSMFRGCESLESLDVTKFNTEKVTNMSEMFYGCESLESLDVTKFNTEKVTNMSYMFYDCESLESLDVTKFNTEKVTNMAWMFYDCQSLKSLDVTKFNTGNVTNMSIMFSGCQSLESLDVTKFNTVNVTDMSCMFYGCKSLKSLDVTKFNTGNVTNMNGMFYGCESLKSLDVTKFNTEKVTDMSSMFDGCESLESLDVTKFNTGNVTDDMSVMFRHCKSLKSLDVTKFNTENVTSMTGMFYGCSSLEYLDVTKFNTEKVTNMSFMFCNCKSLKSLDVTKFNTEKVTAMTYMFYDCKSLESLDVTKFNTEKVTTMSYMFYDCESLEFLDVTKFNTGNVTNMSSMFFGCESLTTILVDESNWKINKVTSSSDMFKNCSELIGDKGTTYTSSKIDIAYAHIDEGVSNPGYLTTGKYKIFYNGIDDDNATLDTYTNAITEFINEEVTLVEPKKDGYEFIGWTGTKITGLTTTPTKTVTIAKGEVGNRIYTAHWKAKITLSVAINGWIYGSTPSTPIVKKNNTEISLSNVVLKYTDENNQEITPSSTTSVGTYTITATYPESATELSATASTTFTISPLVIDPTDPKLSISLNPTSFTYDGTKKEPSVSVKYDGKEIPSSEYTVNYKNNINAGTATAEIVDNNGGNYTINGSKDFEITPFIITATDPKLSITLNPTSFTYDGTKKEPSVLVKYDSKEIPSSEYTVNYKNNINVGTATAEIVDNNGGNYTINGNKTFEITPFIIAATDPKLSITINPTSFTYDGAKKEPSVSVKYDGIEIPSTEYTVTYENNINVGTATAFISDNQGGNYTVSGSKDFTITPLEIDINDPSIASLLSIVLNPNSYIYDGKAKEPAVTITYKGTEIPAAEYTVTYQDNINVGTAKAIISDNQGGNYTISGEAPFTINLLVIDPTDPNLSIIIETDAYEYTGSPIEPKVTVTYNGITIPSTEYTVTYQNNTNVGTATIIITDNPNGNYTINGETQFTIKPGKISITPVNIDADGYILADASNQYFCSGKAVIEFTVSKGNPQNYFIEFDGGDIPSQNGAISGNSVEIELPKDLLPGTYTGAIELTSTDGNSTDKLPIKVIVKLPYYTIVPLYNDVAAVNQLAGEFSAYKWTENGNEIPGANGRILQHTFNKSAVYTAILTKTDGGSYETCPLDLSRVSVGNSTARLVVYPNPAIQGNDITVEVSENYNPEANKQIYIYNLNGTLAKHLSSPQEINKVQLPAGNYSGVYIQNGEKVPFKLIVK